MLTTVERKRIMKEHGFYKGELNSKWDTAYRDAVKRVNIKYLTNDKYYTTTYYTETDNVLVSLDRLKKAPHFKLTEFTCNCKGKYCKGYPSQLDAQLLINLETMRKRHGIMDITCGLRCNKKNAETKGSVPNSGHVKGKAVDVYYNGMSSASVRDKAIAEWKTLPKYEYAYHNKNGKYPNMGNVCHFEVR